MARCGSLLAYLCLQLVVGRKSPPEVEKRAKSGKPTDIGGRKAGATLRANGIAKPIPSLGWKRLVRCQNGRDVKLAAMGTRYHQTTGSFHK